MPHGANSVIMKRYCIYIIMAVTALCVSEAVTAAQNEQEADSLFALPYNVTKTKGQVTGNLYQIAGKNKPETLKKSTWRLEGTYDRYDSRA